LISKLPTAAANANDKVEICSFGFRYDALRDQIAFGVTAGWCWLHDPTLISVLFFLVTEKVVN
jgi:hypothetical protein